MDTRHAALNCFKIPNPKPNFFLRLQFLRVARPRKKTDFYEIIILGWVSQRLVQYAESIFPVECNANLQPFVNKYVSLHISRRTCF